MQRFLTKFFRGVFGRLTSSTACCISVWSFVFAGCVALCCVGISFVLCCCAGCVALCCVVVPVALRCDLCIVFVFSLLCCYLLLFPPDIFLLSFTFVPPQDETTRPTRPTHNGFSNATSSTNATTLSTISIVYFPHPNTLFFCLVLSMPAVL